MGEILDRIAIIEARLSTIAALAAQNPAAQSSVELSRNAKGDTQISVKVYAPSATEAVALAQQLYNTLSAEYPPVGK